MHNPSSAFDLKRRVVALLKKKEKQKIMDERFATVL